MDRAIVECTDKQRGVKGLHRPQVPLEVNTTDMIWTQACYKWHLIKIGDDRVSDPSWNPHKSACATNAWVLL